MAPPPTTAGPRRKLVAVGVTLVLMIGAWFGVVWFTTANERKVAAIVGKQLGCRAEDVTILTSAVGDTGERYEFEACGQSGRALCVAPDFLCTVQLGR